MKIFRKRQPKTASTNPAELLQVRLPDVAPAVRQVIQSAMPMSMTSPERLAALCGAVQYIIDHKLPGDIVECGVWRGGSMVAAARMLLANAVVDRQLWLYDTFEGMTAPGPVDIDISGRSAGNLLAQQDPQQADSAWCVASLEDVQDNLRSTGYPLSMIRFVQGDVKQTLPAHRPQQIALLRLDTDWFESTLHELEHLFPRLSPGGVLIVDDYGHWNGCRQAVDRYLAERRIPLMLNRIDYTGRIGIYYPNDTQPYRDVRERRVA